MSEQLTKEQLRLKENFTNEIGYWSKEWESLLITDERFFKACLHFSAVPWRKTALEPKVKEFIYITVNAAATHLYNPGIKTHIENALKYGATKEEIMEVLQHASNIGVHTTTVSVPILLDELKKIGIQADSEDLTEHQKELKEGYIKQRGYWAYLWESVLKLDEEYFEAFLNFSEVPWSHGVLEPKIKELICVAYNASTTHLYEAGIRVHIQNALKYGATKEELMEVLEITSNIGIQTCLEGVPILVEALKRK